jgi:hypothetical protein
VKHPSLFEEREKPVLSLLLLEGTTTGGIADDLGISMRQGWSTPGQGADRTKRYSTVLL